MPVRLASQDSDTGSEPNGGALSLLRSQLRWRMSLLASRHQSSRTPPPSVFASSPAAALTSRAFPFNTGCGEDGPSSSPPPLQHSVPLMLTDPFALETIYTQFMHGGRTSCAPLHSSQPYRVPHNSSRRSASQAPYARWAARVWTTTAILAPRPSISRLRTQAAEILPEFSRPETRGQ